MTRWRTPILLSIVAIVSMAVVATSMGSTSTAGRQQIQTAGGTYNIGAVLGLTGYLAGFDQPALKGMRFAIDKINKAGGIAGKYKINLIVRDCASQSSQCAIQAKTLLDKGVKLLVTPCDADPSIAAGRVAQAAKIPAISSCASNTQLPAAVGNYMFTNWPSELLEGYAGAEYAYKKNGYRRAFILYSPDTLFLSKLPLAFGDRFTQLGGKVVGKATYRTNATDFTPQITQIKNTRPQPDVIDTAAWEPDFPAFLKQLRGAGVKIPVMEHDSVDTETIPKLGPIVNGLQFTDGGCPTPGSKLAAFNAALAKTGAAPPITAAFGYMLIDPIVKVAVTNAKSIEPTAVRNAIDSLNNVPTLTGFVTFKGQKGVSKYPVAMIEFRGATKTKPAKKVCLKAPGA